MIGNYFLCCFATVASNFVGVKRNSSQSMYAQEINDHFDATSSSHISLTFMLLLSSSSSSSSSSSISSSSNSSSSSSSSGSPSSSLKQMKKTKLSEDFYSGITRIFWMTAVETRLKSCLKSRWGQRVSVLQGVYMMHSVSGTWIKTVEQVQTVQKQFTQATRKKQQLLTNKYE